MILRLNRRERRIFGTAGALALVLAGVGLGLGSLDDGGEPMPAPAPAPLPQPAVAAPAREARFEPDKVQERAAPAAAPLSPSQPVEVEPPYVILDGLTFAAGTTALRLSGLEGPSARTTCRDGNGHPWACGLQARAALNNALRTGRAICTPTDGTADGATPAVCTVDGSDIGEKLVAEGWARPSGAVAASYAEALQEARRAGRGLWNGEWTVLAAGPAQDLGADLRSGMDPQPAEAGSGR
jgi:endonuclease YncB( thermonuclease family)